MRLTLLALLLSAAGSVILAPLLPRPAGAHAFLVQTTPRAGERLADAPRAISMLFSEPVASAGRIEVRTAGGETVATGPVERFSDGTALRFELPAVAPDVYVVEWEVLAADGHLSVGEFAFAVGTPAEIPAASGDSGDATAWPEAVAGWLALSGLLLAFGGLISERFVWAPVARRSRWELPRLPVGWLLALALLGSIFQWLLVAGRAATSEPLLPGWPAWSGVVSTRPGLLVTAQLVLVGGALWLAVAPFALRWAPLPLALALIVAAERGHAGTTGHWWAAPANAVHLLAVGYWVGALGHLALVSRFLRAGEGRLLLGDGARRYAAGAIALVVVALVSGVVSALAQFSRASDLLGTRYGQFLLIKLGLVMVALGTAAGARWYGLLPRSGARPRWGALRRLVRIEAAALLAVVLAAAVLAGTAQPRPAVGRWYLLGPAPLEKPVLRLAALDRLISIHLAATADQLQIELIAPSNRPAEYASVSVQGRLPDGTGFDVSPRRCGPGCVTSAFSWREGTTTITVVSTSEQWGESRVTFELPWPPQPEAPELLTRVIETMQAQPVITVTERATSSPEASSETIFTMPGERFMERELYVTGGATDVHPLPASGGNRALTLFLPGSSIWYRLEFDEEYRLRRETIVSAGNLIERTFTYG